jgi:hypothetical protein
MDRRVINWDKGAMQARALGDPKGAVPAQFSLANPITDQYNSHCSKKMRRVCKSGSTPIYP